MKRNVKSPQWNNCYVFMLILTTASLTWTLASLLHTQQASCLQCNVAISPSCETRRISNVRGSTERSKWEGDENRISYNGPSRVFPKFNYPFPCFPSDEKLMIETPASEGIFFHRPHKTGSTTMVGIILRLVHSRAKAKGFQRCKHRSMHGTARQYNYVMRDRSKSFLFSIIREPKARLISEFFHFDVTAFEKEPTDANFIVSLRNKGHNVYLKDLTNRQYVKKKQITDLDFAKSKGFADMKEFNASRFSGKPGLSRLLQPQLVSSRIFGLHYKPEKVVQDILDDFNFIAIMERMDESLVVLQMLLGLTTKEILYTRARSSGTFSNGWKGRPCFFIMKSFITEGMKTFFSSEEFNLTIANDLLMYQAAYESLDRTIASLDPDIFAKNMAALKEGLKLAELNCKGRVRTMCDGGGNPIPLMNRTCYIWGEGCDYECINELRL
jgi:Sulfotransferase family